MCSCLQREMKDFDVEDEQIDVVQLNTDVVADKFHQIYE